MYAMDTAVHFEHRTESRRPRAERRRASRSTDSPSPVASTPAEVEAEPHSADDFAD